MGMVNTIIVLRNDSTSKWEKSTYILEKGELGIGYVYENDGVTVKNVIVKSGDGEHIWAALPQVEGVFEEDLILTYSFGKYSPQNGFVKVPATGKTTSELLLDAFSVTEDPDVTNPEVTLSASAVIADKEIGSYITGLKWEGGFTTGSYEFGSVNATNPETKYTDTDTGLTSSSDTWSVSNSIDTQTATTEDGTFTLDSANYIQVNSESSKTYATINTKTSYPQSPRIPVNNVGSPVESLRIAAVTDEAHTANINVTGYRKPFWGIKAAGAAIDPANITSAQVRALGKSGTATKGLPTTTASAPYVVAAGSQQVFFLAKAGTYTSLTATDAAAMNAGVTFTKIANAVNVEGANGYTATAYDMFYVDWGAGIDADKKLVLTWK